MSVDSNAIEFVLDRTRLEKVTAERGVVSIQQLSSLAGVHRNSLYPLIRGERSPFTEVFLALCRCLALPPTALVAKVAGADYGVVLSAAASAAEHFRPRLPALAFFLFGSRAARTQRRFSDYDLGVTCGEESLDGLVFLRVKEFVLQRCDNLPVKVDVVNFDEAPLSFLEDFDGAVEYLAGCRPSCVFLKGRISGVRAKTQAG